MIELKTKGKLNKQRPFTKPHAERVLSMKESRWEIVDKKKYEFIPKRGGVGEIKEIKTPKK